MSSLPVLFAAARASALNILFPTQTGNELCIYIYILCIYYIYYVYIMYILCIYYVYIIYISCIYIITYNIYIIYIYIIYIILYILYIIGYYWASDANANKERHICSYWRSTLALAAWTCALLGTPWASMKKRRKSKNVEERQTARIGWIGYINSHNTNSSATQWHTLFQQHLQNHSAVLNRICLKRSAIAA